MAIEIQLLDKLHPDSSLGCEWDNLVKCNPASGFMQSLTWANFKRKMGLEVLHLGLFNKGKLLGGAIFYCAPHNKGAGIMMAPDGPVLPWDNSKPLEYCLELLLSEARAHAARCNVAAVRIAPKIKPPVPEVLRGFTSAPVHLNEGKTLHLSLIPSTQELLLDMKPKGRYNILLSQRKDVRVYEDSDPSSIFKFYSIMQQVSLRDNFPIEPLSFFINLIDVLGNAGMMHVFFAEHENDLLGALMMLTFGKNATYLYGGTSNTKRNYMGGYALQWAAINKAKELGAEIYDFWGYDAVCDPEDSYAGFSRFKSQFGGCAIQYIGAQDYYFMDNLTDIVIKAMKEISLDTLYAGAR